MNADSTPNGEFPHAEADLSATLGVSRTWMREARTRNAALEGRAWSRQKGGRFQWSHDGAVALALTLGVALPPPPVSEEPPPKKTPPTPLRVANCRLSNTRLIACVAQGDDPTDRQLWRLVRVREAARFIRGMEILAEPLEGTAMWQFRGRPGQPEEAPARYPRGKGRW